MARAWVSILFGILGAFLMIWGWTIRDKVAAIIYWDDEKIWQDRIGLTEESWTVRWADVVSVRKVGSRFELGTGENWLKLALPSKTGRIELFAAIGAKAKLDDEKLGQASVYNLRRYAWADMLLRLCIQFLGWFAGSLLFSWIVGSQFDLSRSIVQLGGFLGATIALDILLLLNAVLFRLMWRGEEGVRRYFEDSLGVDGEALERFYRQVWASGGAGAFVVPQRIEGGWRRGPRE